MTTFSLNQAQTLANAFSNRLVKGESLTPAEQLQYEHAKDYVNTIDSEARALADHRATNAEDRVNEALGVTKKFWTPGRTLAAQVLGGIAISVVSVFFGMRFERTRTGRKVENALTDLGLTSSTPTASLELIPTPAPAETRSTGRNNRTANSNT